MNSIALEERRNEINEKLAKKDRKKKKKKKEKKQKGSRDSGASDSNSTDPSNCTHMAESESKIQKWLSFEQLAYLVNASSTSFQYEFQA